MCLMCSGVEWNRDHYYWGHYWPIVPAPVDDDDDDDDANDEKNVELTVVCLARETEVLGENIPQYHCVHHKSHITWHGL
jgi:hypothetical protein